MGVKVNRPPEIELPPELKELGIGVINFFEELSRYNLQMFTRTGGATDLIDDTEQALTSTHSRVSRNAAKINALEKVDFDIAIIDSDFTTSRNQIIICQNTVSINVTLDPQAVAEDTVHIKRTNAVVNIIGLVDGKTNLTINVNLFSAHLVFNGTDWSMI